MRRIYLFTLYDKHASYEHTQTDTYRHTDRQTHRESDRHLNSPKNAEVC